jgi:poly-gamma-glutamate synthesis protein (capsule biosynthesis protein)
VDNSVLDGVKNGKQKIFAVTVPHHDLVAADRSKYLAGIAKTESPKTIILVSPNHFDTGKSDILTTDKTWDLGEKKVIPNSEIIVKLSSDLVRNDENAFLGEHGIKNILPDIANYFPAAKVVPIIIKQDVTKEKVALLADNLIANCTDDCLLITSVDDSHYQPASLSELHDSLTIRALNNMDEDLIWRAEVDSRHSMALSLAWSKAHGANSFHLYKNTNSGIIAGDRDAETTSYIFGDFAVGEKNAAISDEVTFTIAGDSMFDRAVDYKFRENKIYDIFANFGDRVLSGTDLSMLNLEGPISAEPIPADQSESLIFSFPPKTVDVLKWLDINAVSLANNHTMNAGKAGFANTLKVLKENDIIAIGSANTFDETSIARFGSGTSKLSVITIESLEVSKDLTEIIKAEKVAGNRVMIMPHWGTEYEPIHSNSQEKLAHGWIDAGADIIIGSHPHVVQDAELYKSRAIFYSIGNLVFDQTWSEPTQKGLIIAGRFKAESLELVLLPTVSKKIQPQLLRGAEKTDFITKIRADLGLPTSDTGLGYDKIRIQLVAE